MSGKIETTKKQYLLKKPSQQWSEAVLKEREPDTLHDVIMGGHGIQVHGGLETLWWDWELMERCYSSGATSDGLKMEWFDYHDDYQEATNCCPNLRFTNEHGSSQVKASVKTVVRELPSGHHAVDCTDDAGTKHKLSFQLIECKGKTFQQVVCSHCGVVAEASARPIIKTLVEVKRFRNKQTTRFSIEKVVPPYNRCWEEEEGAEYSEEYQGWFKPMGFNFKSFYQAYNYAIGKPAQTVQGLSIRRDS